jgi:hypothetical protein
MHARPAATSLEPPRAAGLYRSVLSRLLELRVPFMVGGGYAFRHYTGIERFTKDLDLFVRPSELGLVLEKLSPIGVGTELLYPHWLAKVHGDDTFIDVVFSSGNGVAVVDDEWLEHAQAGRVMGLPVRLCPAEETIWSKAFVAERERYDGADVAHIIRAGGPTLDWPRILRRFGHHWRVLLSHLVLFDFIYPGERDRVPSWVSHTLVRRLLEEMNDGATIPPDQGRLCRGTLLSREQYLWDIEDEGYLDARLVEGRMTTGQIALWTAAIGAAGQPREGGRRGHRRGR